MPANKTFVFSDFSRQGVTVAMIRGLTSSGLAFGLAAVASSASAQTAGNTLVETTVPDNFDRGRNQSVLEHPRPDYDPLPIYVGSFQVFPRVEAGLGASDNVYQTNDNKQADGYGFVRPSLVAQSNWSLHYFELGATANLKRYFDETERNLSLYNVRAAGRADMAEGFAVFAEGRYNREFESAQTGAVQLQPTGAFSTYDQFFGSLRVERQVGQSRITLAYDHTDLSFNPIRSTAFGTIDQGIRDRDIDRGTVRLEYAFTPSMAIYGQAAYDDTTYHETIPAFGGNRDSKGVRILGGLSFDLAGFMRGKVGLGYVHRDYQLPMFSNVSGFAADVKLEYFPSELTTVTFVASRTVEDTAIGTTSSFYDTRTSLRVDHELLRNVLLHGMAEVIWQDFFEDTLKARNYRLNLGAEYMANRKLRARLDFNGYHRNDNGTGAGSDFYEKSAELSVVYFF